MFIDRMEAKKLGNLLLEFDEKMPITSDSLTFVSMGFRGSKAACLWEKILSG